MSETIQIDKLIEIQIDYVQCSNCGEEMNFSISADTCNDLQISAAPCKCLVDEYIESKE